MTLSFIAKYVINQFIDRILTEMGHCIVIPLKKYKDHTLLRYYGSFISRLALFLLPTNCTYYSILLPYFVLRVTKTALPFACLFFMALNSSIHPSSSSTIVWNSLRVIKTPKQVIHIEFDSIKRSILHFYLLITTTMLLERIDTKHMNLRKA